ncbi:MAG: hypothetical protein M5R36_03630 [Deltaproteobacteria bacterium]|nr:hypothetical protein [Deltaproteobacteria bacterium]
MAANDEHNPGIPRIFAVLCALTALAPAAFFVWRFPPRAVFPAHLEIMEGQMLFQAWRVAQGEPLYVEPSLDAISPPYFPLYFYAVALLIKLAGPGWWTGRLVSFLSAIGAGALFLRRRAKKSPAAAPSDLSLPASFSAPTG